MKRLVERELLDHLPPADAAAQHSRRDLRRINRLMGNARILAQALRATLGNQAPREILELGAGDGQLLLGVARRLAPQWSGVGVRLLDRISVINPSTIREFAVLSWAAEPIASNVSDWFRTQRGTSEVVVANLFIHHFTEPELRTLFTEVASRAKVFIAVEPRRARLPLLASSLLWAIGCNAVTRHDANKSVRAGFVGNELSNLWPASTDWELTERSAGTFSHLFIARRTK